MLDALKAGNQDAIVYRQMWCSALLAPLGTIMRWRLARLNGRLQDHWHWFPVGTFRANIIACLVSAIVSGLLQSSQAWSPWGSTILYAIQSGFAGSMSTVSSFVVEANMLQKSFPHHAKAFLYMGSTLLLACALGLVVYIPIVRLL